MLTVYIILWVLSLLGLFGTSYMLGRNSEVASFRRMLLEMTSQHSQRTIKHAKSIEELETALDVYQWFFEKYTYSQMVHSFKPLTLEAWYTEEEIKRVKNV